MDKNDNCVIGTIVRTNNWKNLCAVEPRSGGNHFLSERFILQLRSSSSSSTNLWAKIFLGDWFTNAFPKRKVLRRKTKRREIFRMDQGCYNTRRLTTSKDYSLLRRYIVSLMQSINNIKSANMFWDNLFCDISIKLRICENPKWN